MNCRSTNRVVACLVAMTCMSGCIRSSDPMPCFPPDALYAKHDSATWQEAERPSAEPQQGGSLRISVLGARASGGSSLIVDFGISGPTADEAASRAFADRLNADLSMPGASPIQIWLNTKGADTPVSVSPPEVNIDDYRRLRGRPPVDRWRFWGTPPQVTQDDYLMPMARRSDGQAAMIVQPVGVRLSRRINPGDTVLIELSPAWLADRLASRGFAALGHSLRRTVVCTGGCK